MHRRRPRPGEPFAPGVGGARPILCLHRAVARSRDSRSANSSFLRGPGAPSISLRAPSPSAPRRGLFLWGASTTEWCRRGAVARPRWWRRFANSPRPPAGRAVRAARDRPRVGGNSPQGSPRCHLATSRAAKPSSDRATPTPIHPLFPARRLWQTAATGERHRALAAPRRRRGRGPALGVAGRPRHRGRPVLGATGDAVDVLLDGRCGCHRHRPPAPAAGRLLFSPTPASRRGAGGGGRCRVAARDTVGCGGAGARHDAL